MKEATTDTNGMASVTFEAGTQEGIQYTVEVDGEQAVPATMDIQVNALPKGTLAVHLSYEGPIEIHGINVRVSHANVNCQKFNAVAPWTADIDGQKTVAGINSTLTFKDLPCAETYLVFATALGPSEHLAAAGCIDAIHVMPQEQGNTDVTLKLYVLTLNPAGT